MRVRGITPFIVGLTVVLLLVGCGGCSKSSSSSASKQVASGDSKSAHKVEVKSLISKSEVEAILGGPVKDGVEENAGRSVYAAEWSSAETTKPLYALIQVTTPNAKAVFENEKRIANSVPVSGVGDAAYKNVSGFVAIKGDTMVQVTASTTKGSAKDLEAEKALAQKILNKF